jgi:type II secretory pathway component PulF
MPRYKYTALAEGGEEIKGEVESISEAAARGMLLRRNLEVTELTQARKKFSEIQLTNERVPPTEIMHFSRQLGADCRRPRRHRRQHGQQALAGDHPDDA